jgi:Na+-translocating ferredoxin:NAD+ oxidoreductase subunit G
MAETVIKHASKTAITLMAFAIVFTALMVLVYFNTKTPIAESEALARMSLFNQIVPNTLHTNNVLQDTLTIKASSLLGTKQPTEVNLAKINGKTEAVILEAIAHDGYAGDIKLLIAIKADETISGVRVITHHETPGLGDYIDIAKDNWIILFNQKSLSSPSADNWKVKKDGGQFDYKVGATITPRAVVKAVYHTLQYVAENKSVLFASNVAPSTIVQSQEPLK